MTPSPDEQQQRQGVPSAGGGIMGAGMQQQPAQPGLNPSSYSSSGSAMQPANQQMGRYRSGSMHPQGVPQMGGPPSGGPMGAPGMTAQQRMPAPWQQPGMPSQEQSPPQPPQSGRMPAPWVPQDGMQGGSTPRPQYQSAPGTMQRAAMSAPQQPSDPMTMRQQTQNQRNPQQ